MTALNAPSIKRSYSDADIFFKKSLIFNDTCFIITEGFSVKLENNLQYMRQWQASLTTAMKHGCCMSWSRWMQQMYQHSRKPDDIFLQEKQKKKGKRKNWIPFISPFLSYESYRGRHIQRKHSLFLLLNINLIKTHSGSVRGHSQPFDPMLFSYCPSLWKVIRNGFIPTVTHWQSGELFLPMRLNY